ncbi:MAG: biotin--[acetyl-CoA-carboxylase] ligase, partial [Thermodesulfovibrionales bacterium]|nr:biotin--[acetyl-CoA-carboxylase] ligase [Thermodesulfovibrionales bacterium]
MKIEIDGGRFIWLESTESTNDHAMALAKDGASSGTVVAAETQTAGRGRLGREWVSPAGLNLYFSIILRPELSARDVPLITLMCAVEAASALKAATGAQVKLKWPNDLLLDGRKLGGILVESHMKGAQVEFVVAGIGININSREEDFPPEVRGIATSLFMASGRKYPRAPILKSVAEGVIKGAGALAKDGAEEMLSMWKIMNATLGRRVRAGDTGQEHEGQAVDLDENGMLLVKKDSGEVVKIISGDVVFLQG